MLIRSIFLTITIILSLFNSFYFVFIKISQMLFQVRLICNDGTRYTKDVDIVRKCACTKKCYWLTHAAIHNSDTSIEDYNGTDLTWELATPQAIKSQPPVKLTFFIPDNMSNDESSSSDLLYDMNNNPDQYNSAKNYRNGNQHDSYCILSAFLYFTTITSFTYLLVVWIKQKMHVQMEVLHWW